MKLMHQSIEEQGITIEDESSSTAKLEELVRNLSSELGDLSFEKSDMSDNSYLNYFRSTRVIKRLGWKSCSMSSIINQLDAGKSCIYFKCSWHVGQDTYLIYLICPMDPDSKAECNIAIWRSTPKLECEVVDCLTQAEKVEIASSKLQELQAANNKEHAEEIRALEQELAEEREVQISIRADLLGALDK